MVWPHQADLGGVGITRALHGPYNTRGRLSSWLGLGARASLGPVWQLLVGRPLPSGWTMHAYIPHT